MDTSTDYFQAQTMPLGELVEFWESIIDVTETRKEMEKKELDEIRKKKGV